MIGVIRSHKGKVRLKNEDSFYLPQSENEHPKLFAVADGMGGHQGGEIASKIAVKEVASYVRGHLSKGCGIEEVKMIIEHSISTANNKIYTLSQEDCDLSGMGTTITMALFFNDRLYIGHVGDSRAYRIRGDNIELLTKDHSLVWQLAEEGRITMEEAKTHPMKNIITKALGTDEFIKPDILEFDLNNDDIVVLCSDGLTNMINDEGIKKIVCSFESEQAAQKLIEEANLNGGEDNITVGIIKVGKVGM